MKVVLVVLLLCLAGVLAHEKDVFVDYNVYFCPQENCEQILIHELSQANKSLDCAFYDLKLDSLIQIFKQKKNISRLVVDKDNPVSLDFAVYDTRSSLMHNKFCIIDNYTVITGSTNPTVNGVKKNANNVVILRSFSISKQYTEEFNELYSGIYGKGNKTYQTTAIDIYFCPEDHCEDKLLSFIDTATNNITFFTFSFTSRRVANHLLLARERNVTIVGVFDKRKNAFSQYDFLKEQGLNVSIYQYGTLHHKVFVIDDMVFTGSYNPTNNGNKRNDENIIVIKDRKLAQKFKNSVKI